MMLLCFPVSITYGDLLVSSKNTSDVYLKLIWPGATPTPTILIIRLLRQAWREKIAYQFYPQTRSG